VDINGARVPGASATGGGLLDAYDPACRARAVRVAAERRDR
jgi:hypothetical protein